MSPCNAQSQGLPSPPSTDDNPSPRTDPPPDPGTDPGTDPAREGTEPSLPSSLSSSSSPSPSPCVTFGCLGDQRNCDSPDPDPSPSPFNTLPPRDLALVPLRLVGGVAGGGGGGVVGGGVVEGEEEEEEADDFTEAASLVEGSEKRWWLAPLPLPDTRDTRRPDPSPRPSPATPSTCLPAARWPCPLAGYVVKIRVNEDNRVSTTVSK